MMVRMERRRMMLRPVMWIRWSHLLLIAGSMVDYLRIKSTRHRYPVQTLVNVDPTPIDPTLRRVFTCPNAGVSFSVLARTYHGVKGIS